MNALANLFSFTILANILFEPKPNWFATLLQLLNLSQNWSITMCPQIGTNWNNLEPHNVRRFKILYFLELKQGAVHKLRHRDGGYSKICHKMKYGGGGSVKRWRMTTTVVLQGGDTIYYEKTLKENIDLFRNLYNFGYLSIIRVP